MKIKIVFTVVSLYMASGSFMATNNLFINRKALGKQPIVERIGPPFSLSAGVVVYAGAIRFKLFMNGSTLVDWTVGKGNHN